MITYMRTLVRRDWLPLLCGDFVALILALYITLLLRYIALPSLELFMTHAVPFAILSLAWFVVFAIVGLYDKHTSTIRFKVPGMVLQAQVFNVLVAAVFFFLIPYFLITPKTNLIIFLIVSSLFIVLWRLFLFPRVWRKEKEKAVLIGEGEEINELKSELNQNPHAPFLCVRTITPSADKSILEYLVAENVTTVIAHIRDPQVGAFLAPLYDSALSNKNIDVLDVALVYEDVFQRVPVGLISHDWFIEHVKGERQIIYDVVKRGSDVILSFMLGVVSILIYPLVYVAIKLDDNGPLFITQERIGKGQRLIRITKFRTMSGASSDHGAAVLKSEKRVTKVGQWLRDFRIDELPQLWSVFIGSQSLIGPRPELPALFEQYSAAIPHYGARAMVKPGLSGWAQIYHQAHPHHGIDIQETRMKLAYDLYYIKNRSVFLDFLIALRTIHIILSRVGK